MQFLLLIEHGNNTSIKIYIDCQLEAREILIAQARALTPREVTYPDSSSTCPFRPCELMEQSVMDTINLHDVLLALKNTHQEYKPFESFFHVLDDFGDDGLQAKTLRDIFMVQSMNIIKDKPEWWLKFKDDTIWNKWMEELAPSLIDDEITESMKKFMRDELTYCANNRNPEDGIDEALDGTFKSDLLIPKALKEELIAAVKPLEDVLEHLKNWHPHSGNLVLDLVHPSLYPLIYGKSRVSLTKLPLPFIPHCGGGSILTFDRKGQKSSDAFSEKYQWLPADISIDPITKKVKIESYINNLHPVGHKKLYYALEKILTKCIPLFDKVLFKRRYEAPRRVPVTTQYSWYDYCEPDDLDDAGYSEWYDTRRPEIPEPTDFENYLERYNSRKEMLLATGSAPATLSEVGAGQVIVKLANIELTPDKPEYEGGSWHIEGMLNERIVSTIIYYYDSENITDNHLSFRQAVCTPDYEQNDNRGIRIVYGLDDTLIQDLGYIITKPDRVIAFPNVYQHKVSKFRLVDPTKPGWRKILAIFLIDPSQRIISTSNVPPQQFDWWKLEVYKIPRFANLPGEIFENIMNFVDWPMSLEEAKKVRLDLMAERSHFVQAQNGGNYVREMNLCEH